MTEALRSASSGTRSWLSNPGNVISLVLAILSIGSAVYNVSASMSVEMTQVRTLTQNNAQQLERLTGKLEQTIEAVNRHVQWSEGRSANLDELIRRIDRLERLAENSRR